MTGAVSDIFISYKAEERKRLIPLVEALEAEGFSVWWDQHISGGTNWRAEIESHLDAAKVVIVVWSKRSIRPDGRFVRDEAEQAQEAGHYLPITIDNVRPPLGFREVQALDLSNWWGKRDDARFILLATTIRHRLEGKEMPRRALATRSGTDRRAVLAGAAGAVGLAGLGGFFFLKPGSANARAVAVLPFANLSGDPSQAYFADGLAEELRSALARIDGLKVIGRTSSEAVRDEDARNAAAKLDVGNILTGSVRRSPATIRVSAQLVDDHGVEKWSETFNRATGDVLQIQTDIAEAVTEQLRSRLEASDRAALVLGGTRNPAAQDLVFKADANRDSAKQSLTWRQRQYEAAIHLDPNYALAYAAKALVENNIVSFYATDPSILRAGLESARQSAKKAIALAPQLPEAHYALASIHANSLEFRQALARYQRARDLPGASPRIRVKVAEYLSTMGRPRQASAVWQEGAARDPLNPEVGMVRALLLLDARNAQAAIPVLRQLLADHPDFTNAQGALADALLITGKLDEARPLTLRLPEEYPARYPLLAAIQMRQNDRAGALATLADIRAFGGDAMHYQYAEIRSQLGDIDAAMAELESAFRFYDPGLTGVRTDHFLDPVRRHPRFARFVERLNYPPPEM